MAWIGITIQIEQDILKMNTLSFIWLLARAKAPEVTARSFVNRRSPRNVAMSKPQ